MLDSQLSRIKYNSDGLVPAIVQDNADNTVLMMAYMNRESLELTLSTGYTHFYSRSRKSLWKKGETSGNVQKVKSISLDCDNDTLLVRVFQENNVACHTGVRSCFFNKVEQAFQQPAENNDEIKKVKADVSLQHDAESGIMLDMLYRLVLDRKKKAPEKSYVTYLFEKGQDKILKKVGEEAAEVIIGSKNMDNKELVSELADLWFHTIVLLGFHEVPPISVLSELKKRHEKMSNKDNAGG